MLFYGLVPLKAKNDEIDINEIRYQLKQKLFYQMIDIDNFEG